MGTSTLRDLTGAVFRASPKYKLRSFEDLTAEQRKVVATYHGGSGMFGVLVPTGPGKHAIKSVCAATAKLFEVLASPGKIPCQLYSQSEPHLNEELAGLVLDDVLEVFQDGKFISGAAAYPQVLRRQNGSEKLGKLAEISVEAVKYASALEINDVRALSARLYFYNRLPVTAYWKNLWPDEETVRRYLGITESGTLTRDFESAATSSSSRGWIAWTSRDGQLFRPDSELAYKLYVSPRPEHLTEVFCAILALAAEGSCRFFKIGCDVFGLLRPDKLVCYFYTFDELTRFAASVERKICGCPAHGVPFSASLTADGILSWGMDPSPEQEGSDRFEPESWRSWISDRLAQSLIDAKENPHHIEPWQLALERMRLCGVDVETWKPIDLTWKGRIAASTSAPWQ